MRIVCPSCATTYTVPDPSIGANGRKVRCARCATRWHVEAPAEVKASQVIATPARVIEPDTMETVADAPARKVTTEMDAWGVVGDADDADDAFADADAAEPKATAEPARRAAAPMDAADDAASDLFATAGSSFAAAEPTTAEESDSAPSTIGKPIETALKPRIVAHHRPRPSVLARLKQAIWRVRTFLFRSRITIGVAVFLGALALPAAGVVLRVPIVRAYPRIASLYTELGMPVNLSGLEFRNLHTLRELENGQPVLVVEGAVGNLTMSTLPMPSLRLALRGADGQEIYAWSLEPKTATVPAATEIRFRSRLTAPPEDAVDIQLRFTEPKTRHAVLP